ncbi:PREDICTED: ubiquitin-associated protein 1-like isoform X2 [Priapulus caudatus]|uniref:Ubiquitin-associated protein 1-like isoform X2 n=1 Tax=Priapulus caudatus TaxID=37621 RepID=A0ABM1E1A9_PRICU|nr:PREDICTED: ubiquitin-associated protein 1-like isoform X2 [Priapulus caudatus]
MSSMSYLEGVPFKIGDKFICPSKITLPISYHQWNPSEILNIDYDFSLEEKVVAWAEGQRAAKEAMAQARAQQVAAEVEAFSRQSGSSESDQGESSGEGSGNDRSDVVAVDRDPPGGDMYTDEVSAASGATGGTVTGLSGFAQPRMGIESSTSLPAAAKPSVGGVCEGMLQPIQAAAKQPDNQASSVETKHTINLEDFENNTDPFDSVELKTINDLEELKNVLQGPGPPTDAQLSGYQTGNYGQAYPAGNQAAAVSQAPTVSMYSDVYVPRQFFPIQQTIPPIPSSAAQTYSYADTANTYSQTGQYSRYMGDWPSSFGQPPCDDSQNSIRRCSKSTPDISIEDDLAPVSTRIRSKSKSPPPRASNMWSPYRQLPPIPNSQDGRRCSETSNRLPSLSESETMVKQLALSEEPNPYNELSSEAQSLVMQLTGMGFPHARTARAVKALGTDDKKVVDHLCLVDALTEEGHCSLDAEDALHIFNQDNKKAADFLKLRRQCLDLGFQPSAVREALIKFNLDRDKALDHLCSTS